MIQVCKECKLISFSQLPSLSSGIEHALEILFDIPALFIEVVKAYIEADTPYDIHIHNIISNLFRLTTAAELYERLFPIMQDETVQRSCRTFDGHPGSFVHANIIENER